MTDDRDLTGGSGSNSSNTLYDTMFISLFPPKGFRRSPLKMRKTNVYFQTRINLFASFKLLLFYVLLNVESENHSVKEAFQPHAEVRPKPAQRTVLTLLSPLQEEPPRCASPRCGSCPLSCRSCTSRASSSPPSTPSSTPAAPSPAAHSTTCTGPYWSDSVTGEF